MCSLDLSKISKIKIQISTNHQPQPNKHSQYWGKTARVNHPNIYGSPIRTCRLPTKTKQHDNLLSVETHRRVATGNTKSREVAGALAGTAPSSTARKFRHAPGGFVENQACHLTYTRSGGCRRAPNSFLHTKTRVNVSPSRGRLPGTTLASALKSRSSPGVRLDL